MYGTDINARHDLERRVLQGINYQKSYKRDRSENQITITGYWLKPITVTGVAGWPKSPTGFDNQVAGY
jgi:hypothetical protein